MNPEHPTSGSTFAPGTVVAGRFRIEREIGTGGMGRVYAATQLALGRSIALKVMLPSAFESGVGIDRFMREAKVAAALHHPSAVEVHDVGRDGDVIYMAMELLDGEILRARMHEGEPYDLAQALTITAEIADLLVAAHAIALVHRDLKPENVFIERATGRVRVVDFGLAFIDGDADAGRLTREGLIVGTPAYLAPEQAQGVHVGTPADIYSLGCMTYELVTGVPPFRGSQMNVITQHLYVAPTRPRDRSPEAGIPTDLDDLIVRMMAKCPDDRPSAADVLAGLGVARGTLAGERHRGRDDSQLLGRAARMVSAVPHQISTLADVEAPGVATPGRTSIRLGVVGELTHEEQLSLASNGIEPVDLAGRDPLAEPIDVILAISVTPVALHALTGTGVPVIATTSRADVDQLSRLLRLGVREVLPLPIRIDELARRVRRVFDRSGRQGPTGEVT